MTKFYSRATGGFYSEDVHGKDSIPGDGFELTDEEWQDLLAQQARGMEIRPGTHGGPVAVAPDPEPGLLVQRDNALRETDWLVARHRDEVELEVPTTLTGEDYRRLQKWRSDLRNLKSQPGFPHITLPECPV